MDPAGTPRRGRWSGLRGVALLAGCLFLSVGSPLLPVVLPLGMLALLSTDSSPRLRLIGAVLIALGLLWSAPGDVGDLNRGWAILLGGGFVATTLAWPGRPFVERGLAALAVATGGTAAALAWSGGWSRLEGLVEDRIRVGTDAMLESVGGIVGGDGAGAGAFAETARRTAEVQLFLFPAQVGVAALLALAGAWWFHQRLRGRVDGGLGPLRAFRFPDPLIWILISGIGLVFIFGWTDGWGRVGANLTAFMGALFAFRGVGVGLALAGGISWVGGLLLAVMLVFAAPVLLIGAMSIGLGDAWFDLRDRAAGNENN